MKNIKKRKALIWEAPEKIKLVDLDYPKLKKNEALLKVETCCICGSDLRTYKFGNKRVSKGQILGHEISGTIVETGSDVHNFKTGENVSIGADIPCGKCSKCLNGMPNNCEINYAIGYQFEGGFTNYMILNDFLLNNGPIVKLNNFKNFDLASLAEPLACCINGFEICPTKSPKLVAIFGAGPIGQILGKLSFYYGAKKVVIIDPNQQRLNKAKELMSANYIINPKKNVLIEECKKISNNEGFNIVFTACSDKTTHEQALDLIAKRGTINFFAGLPDNSSKINISSNFIHYNEIFITGSHGSTPKQHAQAIKLISEDLINLKGIISHFYPLDEIYKAFQLAVNGEAIKIAIKPNLDNN